MHITGLYKSASFIYTLDNQYLISKLPIIMSLKTLILVSAICLVLLLPASGKKPNKYYRDRSPKCKCPSEEDKDEVPSEEDDEDGSPECDDCPKDKEKEENDEAEVCSCGVTSAKEKYMKKTTKSGTKTNKRYKYPWVVTLHHSINIPGPHGYCQGAVLSKSAILTSARCVVSMNASFSCFEKTTSKCFMKASELHIGIMVKDKKKPTKMLSVKNIIPHPKYSLKTGKNDIAIVLLKEAHKCNKYFSPICIPNSDFTEEDQQVVSAGWGSIDENLKESDMMIREGKVKKINPKHCAPKKILNKKKIFCCVGESPASCQGDNGGVVFAHHKKHNDAAFALGVISSTICWNFCNPTSPVTHTLIPAYYSFITENVNDLPSPSNSGGKASPL